MARGLNKVFLIGNLGRDPEVRQIDEGKIRVSFSLATSSTYKMKEGGTNTKTEWHKIVLWSPIAEVAQKYLSKGRQVCIEGELSTRSYEDQSGEKRSITEIVGRNLILLGSRSDDIEDIPNAAPSTEHATEEKSPLTEEQEKEEDNLPF